jgi:MFS family permease
MTNYAADTSQRKAAKVAGFMFLFIVIGWILNWTLVDSKLTVAGNVTATVNNIMANELLFRIGITNELIFSIGGVVLALALYILLKPVNKNLALLALFLKLMEAIIAAVMVLVAFFALQMLNGTAYLTVFNPVQLQDIVGLFLTVRSTGSTISMVFLGLNLIIFLYLLFKSMYVPRILAGFGIFSYSLILVYSLANILVPQNATVLTMVNTISMIFFAPSVLFELMIGLWLIFKGINVRQMDTKNE